MAVSGVKEAVAIGAEYMKDVLSPTDLLLEEVELDRDDSPPTWTITFSLASRWPQDEFAATLSGNNRRNREYKTVTIDATSGDVLAMKIRNP